MRPVPRLSARRLVEHSMLLCFIDSKRSQLFLYLSLFFWYKKTTSCWFLVSANEPTMREVRSTKRASRPTQAGLLAAYI